MLLSGANDDRSPTLSRGFPVLRARKLSCTAPHCPALATRVVSSRREASSSGPCRGHDLHDVQPDGVRSIGGTSSELWREVAVDERRFDPSDALYSVPSLAYPFASRRLGSISRPLLAWLVIRQENQVELAHPYGVSDHFDADDLPLRDREADDDARLSPWSPHGSARPVNRAAYAVTCAPATCSRTPARRLSSASRPGSRLRCCRSG